MKFKKHYILLLFCFLCGVKCTLTRVCAQAQWEVVKVRGNVKSGGKRLLIGSQFQDEKHLRFSSTSDIVLVRSVKVDVRLEGLYKYMMIKPTPFSENVKDGVPCHPNCKLSWVNLHVDSGFQGRIYLSSNCDTLIINEFSTRFGNEIPKWCSEIGSDLTTSDTVVGVRYLKNWYFPSQEYYWGIASPNCRYKLEYQDKGNLVLRDKGMNTEIWSTGLKQQTKKFDFTEDGNLLIFDKEGNEIWSTSLAEADKGCSYLEIGEDGNLRIVSFDGVTKWETRTWNGSVNSAVNGHLNTKNKFYFNPRFEYKFASVVDKTAIEKQQTKGVGNRFVLKREVAGKNTQEWRLTPDKETPFYTIQSLDSLYLISVINAKTQGHQIESGPKVEDDELSNLWDITPTKVKGVFFIRNAKGNYLEADVVKHTVSLRPYTGKPAQQWKMIAVVK